MCCTLCVVNLWRTVRFKREAICIVWNKLLEAAESFLPLYHLLIPLVKQFFLYFWKMPVIFSTVNNLHVELFALIYNMVYKNKAFQIQMHARFF